MSELESLSGTVAGLLIERRQTVSVSESACGGLISAALIAIPGASACFLGGGVIYTRQARRGLLRLTAAQSRQRGATQDYALLTARTIRARLGSTWALGESGAAGPTGNRYGDASGHACFAVSGPIERCLTIETGDDDREANMWRFAKAGLDLLERMIVACGETATVYGIGNCDACRAARQWFDRERIAYRFHNVDTGGLEATTLNAWIGEHGWEALLNRRSKTWRALPETVRKAIGPVSAASLMLAHPKLIRRPVIDFGERSLIGFDQDICAAVGEIRRQGRPADPPRRSSGR